MNQLSQTLTNCKILISTFNRQFMPKLLDLQLKYSLNPYFIELSEKYFLYNEKFNNAILENERLIIRFWATQSVLTVPSLIKTYNYEQIVNIINKHMGASTLYNYRTKEVFPIKPMLNNLINTYNLFIERLNLELVKMNKLNTNPNSEPEDIEMVINPMAIKKEIIEPNIEHELEYEY